jgi:hypothetical protein
MGRSDVAWGASMEALVLEWKNSLKEVYRSDSMNAVIDDT